MSRSPLKEERQAILKWGQSHRDFLRRNYPLQYAAYSAERLLAHGRDLDLVIATAKEAGEPFLIDWITKYTTNIQILNIRFRALARHEWEPSYPVSLKHHDRNIDVNMTVDSGSDVSLISLKLGQDLGFALADSEVSLSANGVGSTVDYVLRNIEMTIDAHDFSAPVAWLQTPIENTPMLLGREVVFEKFNIEFRQADEQIIFTWRNSSSPEQ
jgi:Aspartyl protease